MTKSQSQKTGAPSEKRARSSRIFWTGAVVHPYREIVSVDGADPALHASIRERGKVDLNI